MIRFATARTVLATASIVLAASPAFASKARVQALQGAMGLVDTQTVFMQPAYATRLKPLATLEFGSSSTTGNPKAEGGLLLDHNGTRWGAYFGHQSAYQNLYRGVSGFGRQDNPIDLLWGMGDMGASISLSNSEDQSATAKQTAVILRGGMISGENEFALSIDALGTAEKASSPAGSTDDFKSKTPQIEASYLRRMTNVLFGGSITYGDADQKISNTTTTMKLTGVNIGFNHRPVDPIYWGAMINFVELDVNGKKRSTTSLPVFFGLEKDLNTWFTLRGSLQQNLLLGSVKDDITPVKEIKNRNDTTVAVGSGLKYGNVIFDTLFSAGINGKVNGNDFLSQASLTYTF